MSRLLFICSQNKWRSLTAERLFNNHPHHETRSAGTEPGARVRVTASHLGWPQVILVMEHRHADRLREKFAEEMRGKTVVTLRIPDKYPFQDPTLVALLREKLVAHLGPELFPEHLRLQHPTSNQGSR